MKKVFMLILILVLCANLCACTKKEEDPMPPTPPYEIPAEYAEHFAAVEATVAEINAASNLGMFELLQVDEKSTEDSYAWLNRDDTGSYWTARIYPYGSGVYRIVAISIKSSGYNLLGFTVGDTIEEAGEILLQNGFQLVSAYESTDKYEEVYTQLGDYGLGVILTCALESHSLTQIRIGADDPSDPFKDAEP